MDGFAGDIARRHAADDTSRNVTASVDKITWLQSPPEGKTQSLQLYMIALIKIMLSNWSIARFGISKGKEIR